MKEQPLFFPSQDYDLFGMLHLPEQSNQKGFVFCHPFAEEKLWAHRVYVSFARELVKQGYTVLRFDMKGCGDSQGYFEEVVLDNWLNDINAAIDYLSSTVQGLSEVGLFGLRFGATLALAAAQYNDKIQKLILWEPILDGARYMQEILRSNLSTQLAVYGKVTKNREALVADMEAGVPVNFDGYELTHELYTQIGKMAFNDLSAWAKKPILVVQVGKPDQPVKKGLLEFCKTSPACHVVNAAEEPFWREIKQYYARANNLFSVTLQEMSC